VLLALVPFIAIVALSFMQFRGPVLHAAFSMRNYVDLFATAGGPLANTLLFATLAACGAALIGVPVGWVLARTRSPWTSLLDVTATLPFAVPGTVLAIGLVIAFNSGGLVLTGGWLIMVLAYTVRKLPFTVRSSSAILYQIDPSLEEAPSAWVFRAAHPIRSGHPADAWRHRLRHGAGMGHGGVRVVLHCRALFGPWRTLTIFMFQALEGTGAGVASPPPLC